MSKGDEKLLYIAPWNLWLPSNQELIDRDVIGRIRATRGVQV
jgi:hypothetical protein